MALHCPQEEVHAYRYNSRCPSCVSPLDPLTASAFASIASTLHASASWALLSSPQGELLHILISAPGPPAPTPLSDQLLCLLQATASEMLSLTPQAEWGAHFQCSHKPHPSSTQHWPRSVVFRWRIYCPRLERLQAGSGPDPSVQMLDKPI